jgi:hypothetical protein
MPLLLSAHSIRKRMRQGQTRGDAVGIAAIRRGHPPDLEIPRNR